MRAVTSILLEVKLSLTVAYRGNILLLLFVTQE